MKEYEALVDRKKAADMRLRLNAGYIWSAILNAAPFADPNRRAVQPSDIVPGLAKDHSGSGPDLTQMSGEEQAAHMKALFPTAVTVVN